jgi:hypothetical protein
MADKAASLAAEEAIGLNQEALLAKYRHEASEHRRMLFERGSGLHPTWKNFRKFLSDIGPAPSQDHLATRLAARDLTYGPGKVAWMHRNHQPVPVDLLASVNASGGASHSQWLIIDGKPVEYTTLAKLLGVPFEGMAATLRSKVSPEEMVQQAAIAKTLCQADTPFLPPERREAFLAAYRMWHMQIRPNYAAAATPGFLFIYSALPSMLKLMHSLDDIDLWDPPTIKGKTERRDHDLWRRYCEIMVRVEAARMDCPISNAFSLTTELPQMWDRVRTTEERYRKPPPV